MTLSENLPFAILALDSYARGYGAGLETGAGSAIGNASFYDPLTLISASKLAEWQAAGFCADVYTLNGQVVISYRGTDNIGAFSSDGSDLWHGWTVGAGNQSASQAGLAAEFYQTVKAHFGSVSCVTGHSLGGGLAGLVARIYGPLAFTYDNMPYEQAAANVINFANAVTDAQLMALAPVVPPGPDGTPVPNSVVLAELRTLQSQIMATFFPGKTVGAA